MLSEDIEGWYVSLAEHLGDQELRIFGPGELEIVISQFSTSKFKCEGYLDVESRSKSDGMLNCTYSPIGDHELYLSIFYCCEPPAAALYTGCAHWDLPVKFAEYLYSVMVLGHPLIDSGVSSHLLGADDPELICDISSSNEKLCEQLLLWSDLTRQLHEMADTLRMVRYRPTLAEAVTAIQPYFPTFIIFAGYVEVLLELVGLVVIVDIGQGTEPKRLSWSIAESELMAQAQLKKYQRADYCAVRKGLGINYHWIFLVPHRNLTAYSDDFLVDGLIDFDIAGRPNCWILDRFR